MSHYKRFFTITLFGLSLLFWSCDQSEAIIEVQDEHVCEHLIDGPEVTIDAATDMSTAIDSLAKNGAYRVQAQLHTRYDIVLNEGNVGTYSGYVPYEPLAGDGDYTLYMDKSVEVSIVSAHDSVTVVPETVTSASEYCESIKYKAVYHLHAEETYVLGIQNSTYPIVGVLFPATEKDDDDHDH